MDVRALYEKPHKNNENVTVLTAMGSQEINQISALKQKNIVTISGQKVHNEKGTNNNHSRKLRSLSDFDFKHTKHSSRKRGHDAFPFCSIDLQSKIKDTCMQRNDKWSYDVASRLASVMYLPAADVVYYLAYCVNFRIGKCVPFAFQNVSSKGQSRRPCRDENEGVFLAVVEYLEDCEDLLTLTNLVHVTEKVSRENAH